MNRIWVVNPVTENTGNLIKKSNCSGKGANQYANIQAKEWLLSEIKPTPSRLVRRERRAAFFFMY